MSSTAALIGRLRQLSILVVGDVMLDEYVEGDSSRVSPEAPVPILKFSDRRAVPGGAANTAANIVALGASATLVGVTGEDDAGRQLAEACRSRGIALLPIHDGRATTRKVRVMGQRQQLLRVDYESVTEVDAATEARILAACARGMADAALVVVSDYAKGMVTGSLCRQIVSRARSIGKPVVIDPRPQHAMFYTGCDYLTPNWKEGRALLGWEDATISDSEVERTGDALVERFRCGIVLTLGPRGIALFPADGSRSFNAAASAREVFDVSGAGDTVVAAFALAIAAQAPPAESVAFANRAAAIVVGKYGTATASPHELLADAEADPRLLERDELAQVANALRARGKQIVTINGSFDLLHAGHLHILREARRQGDVLIVGLNSDSSVRANKGARRPIVPEAARAEMLLALRVVDYVHIFNESVPMAFIAEVRPDVHVNGAEYGTDCVEAAVVRDVGARLHLVRRIEGFSTSALIERL